MGSRDGFLRAVNFFCQLFLIKWFLLFWMCDLVALTHQCKLMSFFIFDICCCITKMHLGCHLLYPASHHVTSSVSWPFNSSWGVSYRWSMVTMRLPGTVIEIFSLKDIAVTTLTFWGHVTSSVTWRLNSACVVYYWWSIVTVRLSCTVKPTSDDWQSWPTVVWGVV